MSSRVTSTGLSVVAAPRASAALNPMAPSMRQARHHLLHLLDDQVDDPALRPRQHVADLGGDHVLDRRAPEHLLQDTGEVLEDDDGLGARVLELVLELARRVERIDVHHDHAGAQDAEQRHRVLQQVRRHDGDALALAPCPASPAGRRRSRATAAPARHRSGCGRGCGMPACRRTCRRSSRAGPGSSGTRPGRSRWESRGDSARARACSRSPSPADLGWGAPVRPGRGSRLTRERRCAGHDERPSYTTRHVARHRASLCRPGQDGG